MSRRFIAGARCQGCRAEDTLYFDSQNASDIVLCVDCGFTEARPKSVDAPTPPSPDEIVPLKFPMT
ncbi:MAG: YheV family putative metal-binding protein [Pseudomonadales bacterium]|nr:YheV family putative metal-binding protein [Pseudomonadales bacterium]